MDISGDCVVDAPRAVVSPALHARFGCDKTAGARPVVVRAFAYVGHLSLIRFQLCHCSSLLVCLLAPLAVRALPRRNGRRAVFGQQVRCIFLLLGNLFSLGRQGLRRFALTALTAVRSESEAAI